MIQLLFVVKMSFCFTVLYGAYRLALSRNTFHQVQRLYLLAIPVLSISIPLPKAPFQGQQSPLSVRLPEILIGAAKPMPPQSAALPPLDQILLDVYYLGVIFMIVRLLVGLEKLFTISALAAQNEQWSARVAILESFKGAGSFFNFIILGKDLATDVDPIIIEHEKVHIAQKHSFDLLFAELFRAVNWFNPLSYSYVKALRLQHEYIADRHVCEVFANKGEYVSRLIAQSFSIQSLFQIHSFSKPSTLKTRIMNLNQKSSPKTSLFVFSALVPVCTALSFICMSFSMRSFHESQRSTTLISVLSREIRDTGKVYTRVQQLPEYPNGEKALLGDLSAYLSNHYPSEAKKKNIEGRVTINFIVETDGQISNLKIIRGTELSGGLPEAALQAVQGLKRFTPGKQNGIPVRVSYSVPILFSLKSNR